MFMKSIKINFFKYFNKEKQVKQQIVLCEEICTALNAKLSIHHIEQYLNIQFNDFNEQYFKHYFPKYYHLYSKLTIIELLIYIDYTLKLRSKIKQLIFKKIAYPILLIVFSYLILIVFKFAILNLLHEYMNYKVRLYTNVLFYGSTCMLLIIIMTFILLIVIEQKKDLKLMLIKQLPNYILFNMYRSYYQHIFIHLMLQAYQRDTSTKNMFQYIKAYQDNPIIANLAYYLDHDLDLGLTFLQAIDKMSLNEDFKKMLSVAIHQQNFEEIMAAYQSVSYDRLERDIIRMSQYLMITTYLYVGLLLMLFYSILSLPLQLIHSM